MMIKDGTFWISSFLDGAKSQKDPKPNNKNEDDWDKIDYTLWLVVKSFKSNNINKSVI